LGLGWFFERRCLIVMRVIRSCLALCAAGFVLAALLTGQARADLLDSLKKTYGAISTAELRFNQKITMSALKRQREASGEFFYKRGKGFLWKYTVPTEKVFLYDGTSLWQAEEDRPTVIRQKVNKGKTEGNFFDLVNDVTRIDDLFSLKETTKQGDMDVMLLLPKKEGTVQSARIWVDGQFIIRKMEIVEITGNVNLMEFSSINVNKSLPDTLFVFKPGNKEIEEQ
jgi:chaperone LolA